MKGSRHGPLGTGPLTRSFQAEVLWTAYKQGYYQTLSLKTARQGAHALGSCQNHTHSGPQITPSRIFLLWVLLAFGAGACLVVPLRFPWSLDVVWAFPNILHYKLSKPSWLVYLQLFVGGWVREPCKVRGSTLQL